MSNQDFGRESSTASQSAFDNRTSAEEARGGFQEKARDAYAKASDTARDAGERVRRAASDTASSAAEGVKDVLNRQIGSGAQLAGHFAGSMRVAADDLARESPMAAGLVRDLASKVDGYATDFQDQTVDQLARAASDYTRRQPALVFGLAALAGFFAFRTMKNSQAIGSPSIQPAPSRNDDRF